ncbi:MAG TPA: glycosyltransferase, partial [Myxococcales bacterium]|nr:glycosyltransferase [Myxococcales bacterium]
MRILVSALSRAISGGAETYLRALLPHLAAAGHHLSLFTEHGAVADGAERLDAGAPGLELLDAAELGPTGALARARDFRPDVVFHHGFVDAALEAALVRAFPTALYAHAYYGTCLSGTKLLSFPEPEPCRHPFTAACLVRYFPRRCGGRDPRKMWEGYRLQRARREHLP